MFSSPFANGGADDKLDNDSKEAVETCGAIEAGDRVWQVAVVVVVVMVMGYGRVGKEIGVSCGLLQTIWCSRLIALCLIHGKVYYDMAFGFELNTDRLRLRAWRSRGRTERSMKSKRSTSQAFKLVTLLGVSNGVLGDLDGFYFGQSFSTKKSHHSLIGPEIFKAMAGCSWTRGRVSAI